MVAIFFSINWKKFSPFQYVNLANIAIEDTGEEKCNAQQPSDIKEKKKEEFLKTRHIIVYFYEQSSIVNLYNQTIKRPKPESRIREFGTQKTTEYTAGITGHFDAKTGKQDLSKETITEKFNQDSLSDMFIEAQEEAIKLGWVKIGLEEININQVYMDNIQEFGEIIKRLSEIEFDIDINSVESYVKKSKMKAAEPTIRGLEDTKDSWVLIECDFKITEDSGNYIFSYLHPVNTFLEILGDDKKITISFVIKKESMAHELLPCSVVSLKVYGLVLQPINRDEEKLDLKIHPIVAYKGI